MGFTYNKKMNEERTPRTLLITFLEMYFKKAVLSCDEIGVLLCKSQAWAEPIWQDSKDLIENPGSEYVRFRSHYSRAKKFVPAPRVIEFLISQKDSKWKAMASSGLEGLIDRMEYTGPLSDRIRRVSNYRRDVCLRPRAKVFSESNYKETLLAIIATPEYTRDLRESALNCLLQFEAVKRQERKP